MILQHIYKPIFNIIYEKLTYRIGEKTRNIILVLCFLGIFACQFISQYIFEFDGFNRGIRDYLICLFFGVALLASADRRLEILEWRKSVYIPYTVAGILILVASLDHEMGPAYQAFPLVMLTAFICMFYIWGNRGDYGTLFNTIAKAFFLFISVFFLICVIYFPYESSVLTQRDMEYAPLGINPNGVTKLFLAGVACGLYLSLTTYKSWMRYLYLFFVGGFCAVIVLTKSRIAYIILILLAIIYLVSLLTNKNSKKQIASLIGIILIACAIFHFAVVNITPAVKDFIVADEVVLESGDNVNDGNIDVDIQKQEEHNRYVYISQKIELANDEIDDNKLLVMLDSITSGRITIWKVFIENMSWRGESELLFIDTEFAHNQYIELSYKAGIPTGIIYLIFVAGAGIHLLINLFKKEKRTSQLFFQLFIYCVFFVTSMLDTGVLPFERGFIFLFYISIAPLFINNKQ